MSKNKRKYELEEKLQILREGEHQGVDATCRQEFPHVATPEENSYVESLFSQVEREVLHRCEFDSLYHDRDIFQRYFNGHNNKKRRHVVALIAHEE